MVRIVAICGSLRRQSCNMGMLRHCKQILSKNGVTLDIIPSEILGSLPLFNQDVEADAVKSGKPVHRFTESVGEADAYLFAACEYNGSISAPLKNSIDWGSRTHKGNIWNNKPVAIIGAGGYAGTTRAQGHLRDICHNVNMKNMNGEFGSGLEVRVQIFQDTPEPFDADTGNLKSEFWQAELEKTMTGLLDWTKRISPR